MCVNNKTNVFTAASSASVHDLCCRRARGGESKVASVGDEDGDFLSHIPDDQKGAD
jgi:hypothetical protein